MTSAQSASVSDDTAPTSIDFRLRPLPPAARDKFERLRRIETRARVTIDGLYDEMQRVRDQRDDAMRELAHFDRQQDPNTFTVEVDETTGLRKQVPAKFPERDAILQRIEAFKSELQHLASEQAAAKVGFSTENILDWLSERPRVKFVAAPAPFTKPAKSENLIDALGKTREAAAACRDELLAAQNARRTVAEVKKALRAEVAGVAERGRPDVSNLFLGSEITWPSEQLFARVEGTNPAVASATIKDALSLAVWANAPAIIARLDEEIERCGDDKSALTREAQAERVAERERALVDLRRQEEAIIERLEAQGQRVVRLSTDPLILLGIDISR